MACQRFFTQHRESNYFEMRTETEKKEDILSSEDAVARELWLLEESREVIEENRRKKIRKRKESIEFVL